MIVSPHKNSASKSSSDNESTIYGLRPVIEAIDGGTRIDRVFLQNGLSGPLAGDLKGRIRDKGIPFQSRKNHQGVVALIAPIDYHRADELLPALCDDGRSPFVLLLDHVTDVRNFGAIVRTAECAGVDAVIIPDHGSAQVGNDAVKTSSGALLRMPICLT